MNGTETKDITKAYNLQLHCELNEVRLQATTTKLILTKRHASSHTFTRTKYSIDGIRLRIMQAHI